VRRLAIVGAGAWGTALAAAACRAGARPVLWARDPALAAAIAERRENPYLSGIALDPAITVTADPDAALAAAEAVILVVPAQSLRGVLVRLSPLLPAGAPLLLCAKGIETASLKTMSEVASELLPQAPCAVLSGPSFAVEVARGLPTAVTVASRDPALARAFAAALGSSRFRPYLSDDPLGTEIGGAVKNVVAIACGIVVGCGLGDNARAALITRGLAEMVRLGVAKDARPETFRGLSGLGDLVLTCSATQSRNHALGLALGRGEALATVLKEGRTVEGVATAAAAVALARRLGVEMPICEAVDAVLHRNAAIADLVKRLLRRPTRSE
ncbi:MAG: NAD(P)H-dependent glycerol-3-phosphate dehydrogenase, partial [Stellaceae bacterium]